MVDFVFAELPDGRFLVKADSGPELMALPESLIRE